MNLEDLVKNVLENIIPQLKKRILIFFTGGTVNAEILLKILAEFDETSYDVVISDHGKNSLPESALQSLKGNFLHSFLELEDSLNHTDFVLIPVMTRNTLAKAALGIEDNLVTTGIARALMMNKEVFAVKDSFDFTHPINRLKDLAHNSAYNAMLKQYELQLIKFGVKFIKVEEFKTVVQGKIYPASLKRQDEGAAPQGLKEPGRGNPKTILHSSILTLGDLRECEELGTVQIKQDAIITPLAKDFIEQHHLSLEFINE